MSSEKEPEIFKTGKNKEITQNKKKIKREQKIFEKVEFEDLEGKLLLVKIGSNERRATDKELTLFQSRIEKEIRKNQVNCIVLVADHTTTVQIIEKQPLCQKK